MENIIQDIENKYNVSELDILNLINAAILKSENESQALKNEALAFSFVENSEERVNGWGTYFGPSVILPMNDGTVSVSPSITHVQSSILEYWEKRAGETKNPILKARYLGLVWDFSEKVKNEKPNHKIGLCYIDCLLDVVERMLHKYKRDLISKSKRALQLSVMLSSTERIERCKQVIMKLEDQITNVDKAGLWGFSYDLLIRENKLKLEKADEDKIIEDFLN
jgi:hypothetical protein